MERVPEQRNLVLILARAFAAQLATAVFLVDAEGTTILHVRTDRAENVALHRRVWDAVSGALPR